MFNITSHLGNTNLDYNEISLHTYQNSYEIPVKNERASQKIFFSAPVQVFIEGTVDKTSCYPQQGK